jgi:apolipoprotein N-acyltransferase
VRVVGVRRTLTVAAIWTGCEYLRGLASGGFPWLLLGHSQARLPLLCQVADATGVYGVTFCVAAVNALLVSCIASRRVERGAVVRVAAVLAIALGYGVFRLNQARSLAPARGRGPRVMVVQSNFPFGRGGARSVSREASAEFHITATAEALDRAATNATGKDEIDLVVWSEAVMPPLNGEARQELSRAPVGRFLEETHRRIGELASAHHLAIVTGGYFVGGWTGPANARTAADIRNSAFVYGADGTQLPQRYDKIELVPFAERMPFAWAGSWARSKLLWLAAPSARQPDTAGDPDALTIFRISGGRFVTPICFENVDARFVAKMVAGRSESESKSADFLVNLTNDGWFAAMEHEHHFRCATTFRAIENRVPIARASNTGISGFVDSSGRVIATLPSGVSGTLTATLPLDGRTTFYQRFGDVFAMGCTLWAVAAIVIASTRSRKMV